MVHKHVTWPPYTGLSRLPASGGRVPRIPCATDNDLITSLQLAAIDLGSNSFRLEIGRADGGQIYVLDSLRSNVRLAAGLNSDKRLTAEAMERGLEAIALFAQRLNGFDATRVRAVGTNT